MSNEVRKILRKLHLSTPGRAQKALARQPKGNAVVFPTNELDYNQNSSSSDWISKGSDPQFVVKLGSDVIAKGWYMLEVSIHAPIDVANAKLYIESEESSLEDSSVCLPYRTGALTKRLVYVSKPVVQIRFDPLEVPGNFKIETLRLIRVSQGFAKKRMLKKIIAKHSKYSGKSPEAVKKAVQELAFAKRISFIEQLNTLYGDLFVPFMCHTPPVAWSYADWIEKHEKPHVPDNDLVKKALLDLDFQPKISILLPTYNSDLDLLKKCIDSVVNQTYGNWELCIADDCSDLEEVGDLLRFYADEDKRIKLVIRENNGHISAASNSALELVEGDYVALLDHDDELATNALFYVVEQLNLTPNAKLIYSDEDKVDISGERSEPNFKPDWNPDLLYSQNYICHLAVYKTSLIKSVNGFRIGVEGSQDHDLLLRCTSKLDEDEIVHIPKVLYHWRKIAASTASDHSAKSYTTDSGIKGLQNHFKAPMSGVKVETGLLPNTYRVRFPVKGQKPLVSLLIPTRDQVEVLKTCITSILEKTDYPNYEILIIDNQSCEQKTLNYFKDVSKDKRVRILSYDEPFNYSAINNYGVSRANGELVGLVNNDIEVINDGWLSEMVSHANRKEIGCVGAKLYYSNDQIQHAGVILGLGGVAGHSHKHFPKEEFGYVRRLKVVQNLSAVTAACLLVKKKIFQEVNGLNEENLAVAFNDVDFCLKVREAGYRNLWTPYAELYHHESISRGFEDTPEKQARFFREISYMQKTWGGLLMNDPAYNPNLSKDKEDFSLAA